MLTCLYWMLWSDISESPFLLPIVTIPLLTNRLIDGTKTDESNEIYVTKLALSVGRSGFSSRSCGRELMICRLAPSI